VEEAAMGKFFDADIVHQGLFTPEDIDVLNFVTKTAIGRLDLTMQEEVEHIASAALSVYSKGITDPELLLTGDIVSLRQADPISHCSSF
jgi:hypothetical protein